jgi:hypothetical protein
MLLDCFKVFEVRVEFVVPREEDCGLEDEGGHADHETGDG